MREKAFRIPLLIAALTFAASISLQAAPSLPITKPPVAPNNLTGPMPDPMATNGQWFVDIENQEEYRTHEFYDNIADHGGGDKNSLAIEGVVSSVTTNEEGQIIAFDVYATIYNDTPSSDGQWADGSNSHEEMLSTEERYVGTLLKTKLTAEFAISDLTLLPAFFAPPYRDRQPYIIAENEDQRAWYCWNPEFQQEQDGNYYVPTWDFGDIPVNQQANKTLSFIVDPPMDHSDPRYEAIMFSLKEDKDIFANRTTSLKISTWIDELAIDTGAAYFENPLRSSDVSVFHNAEEEEEELLDWGDAPDSAQTPQYPTLALHSGANHFIVEGAPYFDDATQPLSDKPDPEPDGQPNATATGDDNDGNDDEDGIVFGTLTAGQPGSVTITVAGGAGGGYVDAWIDFNGDGIWATPSERIQSGWLLQGPNPINFPVPASAVIGQTFARFRINSQGTALPPTGGAPDGEVEDHEVTIEEEEEFLDWGDAPDVAGALGFNTLAANSGANHTIVPGVYMGAQIDAEPNGQPTPAADGDDLNGAVPFPPGDEDGVVFMSPLAPGQNAHFNVTVSVPGWLDIWLDVDASGTWTAPDHIWSGPVNPGSNPLLIPLPYNMVPGSSYMRFRYNTSGPLPPTGWVADGEVEDYKVFIEEPKFDWGDAPDGPYPTLASSIGANHIIATGIQLGALIDPEMNGQPDPNALGDDNNNLADEDGIVFVGKLVAGSNATVTVASSGGRLDAWIDFDANGNWAHPGEHLWSGASQVLVPGTTNLVFAVPQPSALGQTFARFRLSSPGGLPPDNTGILTPDGEVEDYTVDLYQQTPTNLVITNLTFIVSNTVAKIEWTSESGILYQMQATTNLLVSNSFTDVEAPVPGPINWQTNNMSAQTCKFYRITAPWVESP